MKKQTLFVLLGLWLQLTYAQQKNNSPLDAVFDKILSEQFQDDGTGATALVAKKGEIIYAKSFGMANLESGAAMQVDHVFRIGSIAKQFTAIAILQLMEQGKLGLEDEITKFIPDYPLGENKITVEHLLTHTSGIQDFTSMKDTVQRGKLDFTPNQMIAYFKNQPMRFAPGQKWEYSNSNYFLLGYIIEKITGKTYAEYLEEHFFQPLGMIHSLYANDVKIVKNRANGYSQNDTGFENAQPLSMTQPYAAGAIQSTVGDLFKWHQAIHSYKLVRKKTLDKAWTRYRLADGKETAYGYGWRLGYVYDSPSVWHGGLINGFICTGMYLPKEDIFVAVFSNCDCNSPVDITSKLAALAAGTPYEYKEIPVAKERLQEYAGVYENQKKQQRILTVSENGLCSQIGRGPKSNISAHQKDQFFFKDNAMVTIAFIRNKKGQIEKLIAKNLNGNDIWQKTGKPIPNENGIHVNSSLLEKYVGTYQVTPEFVFSITKEQDKLFLVAQEQEKLEMFAETETKFFLKVNDAQFEFVTEANGKVVKAILNQGGRQADARKVE